MLECGGYFFDFVGFDNVVDFDVIEVFEVDVIFVFLLYFFHIVFEMMK